MRKMLIFLPFLMFGASAFASPSITGAYDQGQIITNNLSALVGVPYVAFADNMREFIPAEYQADAAAVFQKQWNSKTGKITFEGLLNICVAGHITHCQEFPYSSQCKQEGYEIASIGYDTCIKFIQGIIKDARRLNRGKTVEAKPITRAKCKKLGGTWQDDGTGHELCLGKDGKHLTFSSSCGDGWGVCVRVFQDVQTQPLTAIGLADIWGQKNDLMLTCEQEPETRSFQYYLRCSANGEAYEFEFDDVEESKDNTIDRGLVRGICTLFDLKYDLPRDITAIPSGGANPAYYISSRVGQHYHGACLTTDSAVCAQVNSALAKTGYTAQITTIDGVTKCELSPIVHSVNSLRTAFGLNNTVFQSSIQVDLSTNLVSQIRNYVAKHMADRGETLTSFSCNIAPTHIGNDDVLTCYVNGQPVDFVFDDLSESTTYEQDGSMAGISCMIYGGKYDGKHCRSLDREQCALANDFIPGGTDWDQGANACVLNDAKQAQKVRNGISIATGIVVTIGTLGIASAAGAGVTGAYYLVAVVGSVAIDGVLIGLERLQEVNPHHRALSFMFEAQHCNEKQCAYLIVNQHFARLNEIVDQLEPDEMSVVASEMDRMASLLSDAEFSAAVGSSQLNERDIALKVATPAVMVASIFVAPEQAIDDLFKSAPRLLGRCSHWLGHIGATGTHVDDIVSVVSRFNKSAFLRSSSSLNGASYYRIYIDDGDNVADIINELQRQGFYVSAGTEQGGRRFLGASDADIFGPWDKVSGNWLNNVEAVLDLRTTASAHFDEYLDQFLQTGQSAGLPAERMSPEQWKQLNAQIANQGVELVETTSNGNRYMVFRRLANHVDEVSYLLNLGLHRFDYNGVPVYIGDSSKYAEIARSGNYYVDMISTKGYVGSPKIVIAISKSDARKYNLNVTRDGRLMRVFNNPNLDSVYSKVGSKLTEIKGVPVMIENFGVFDGRPIIMVRIEDMTLPFYASTGTAGKTEVATGKWEFFGGIDPVSQWFNKGNINAINSHYDIPELKQIADALNRVVGDVRDTELFLMSAGRQSQNVGGYVGILTNAPDIDLYTINRSLEPGPAGSGMFDRTVERVKKFFNQLGNGGQVARVSNNLDDILRRFNKQTILRRASENSLGHDYYRIVVTNKDDVSAIIAALQKQGYYVSSNMDNSGKYFLAISDKNIFGPWDNAPTNWLRDGVDSVFSRIYDNMPDYVLESKLKYVYENSATEADAVRALKQVNAFDEARATAMANDLADELVSRFATRTDLIDMAKQWKKLDRNQRKYLVDQVHELVTTMRRDHVGNTVIIIDDVNVLDGAGGIHWMPTSMSPRQFAYSVDAPTFAKMLDIIVHENTHAFQSLSKSSIPRPFIDWAQRYYVQPKQNYKLYFDNVIEVEARHVGGQVSSIVSRRLGFK